MFARRLITTLTLIGLTVAPALAQTPSAVTTQPVRPSAVVPVTLPAPVVQPVMKKVNLNTATLADLDALPDVGPARSKAIVEERAKSPFKDWADFDKRMTGTTMNASVKTKLQTLVTF